MAKYGPIFSYWSKDWEGDWDNDLIKVVNKCASAGADNIAIWDSLVKHWPIERVP